MASLSQNLLCNKYSLFLFIIFVLIILLRNVYRSIRFTKMMNLSATEYKDKYPVENQIINEHTRYIIIIMLLLLIIMLNNIPKSNNNIEIVIFYLGWIILLPTIIVISANLD